MLELNDATKDVYGEFVDSLQKLVVDTGSDRTAAFMLNGACTGYK
jgi:hypothetical protein